MPIPARGARARGEERRRLQREWNEEDVGLLIEATGGAGKVCASRIPEVGISLSMDGRFPVREGEMEVGDDLCWAKIGKGFNGRGGIPNKSDFLPIFKTRKLKR